MKQCSPNKNYTRWNWRPQHPLPSLIQKFVTTFFCISLPVHSSDCAASVAQVFKILWSGSFLPPFLWTGCETRGSEISVTPLYTSGLGRHRQRQRAVGQTWFFQDPLATMDAEGRCEGSWTTLDAPPSTGQSPGAATLNPHFLQHQELPALG